MRLRSAMVENIRLRVSVEEKDKLRIAAACKGLTLSEYMRHVATEAASRVAA